MSETWTPEQFQAWREGRRKELGLDDPKNAKLLKKKKQDNLAGHNGEIPSTAYLAAVKAKEKHEPEHDMQVELVNWFREEFPQFELLFFAIPNGAKVPYKTIVVRGKSIQVAPEREKLIKEGLVSGVPDVCLAVPRGRFAGLYLELKVHPNKPSENQFAVMAELARQGYCCQVGWTIDLCKEIVKDYLSLPEREKLVW